MDKSRDQDRSKGAMEQDQRNQGRNTSMQGQLGHRDEDAEVHCTGRVEVRGAVPTVAGSPAQ